MFRRNLQPATPPRTPEPQEPKRFRVRLFSGGVEVANYMGIGTPYTGANAVSFMEAQTKKWFFASGTFSVEQL